MFVLMLLLFLLYFALLNVFQFFLVGEVLLEEEKDLILVPSLHGLLQPKHLVADVVAHLDSLVFVLELLTTTVFQNHLALLVGAFVLLAPLLVLLDLGEEHQFFTEMAADLKDLDELLQDVRAGAHSQLPRTLERAALWPLSNASLAEELPAVVALHGVDGDLKADATDQ